jgi:hypothetical protein
MRRIGDTPARGHSLGLRRAFRSRRLVGDNATARSNVEAVTRASIDAASRLPNANFRATGSTQHLAFRS